MKAGLARFPWYKGLSARDNLRNKLSGDLSLTWTSTTKTMKHQTPTPTAHIIPSPYWPFVWQLGLQQRDGVLQLLHVLAPLIVGLLGLLQVSLYTMQHKEAHFSSLPFLCVECY